MYEFGVGTMFSRINGTSYEFGTLQNVSFDWKFDLKQLRGRKQMPVHLARGQASLEGKAEYADIKGGALNLILNGTQSSGMLIVAEPITTNIPATTPFTVTFTAPNSGVLKSLLVVYDVSGNTKVPLTMVAGTPETGEYSYTNGTITFAEEDAGLKIQYQFDYTVTTGKTIAITNNIMGTAPSFELEFYANLDNTPIVFAFNKVITSALGMSFKNEDYLIPNVSFQCYADAADIVGYVYVPE